MTPIGPRHAASVDRATRAFVRSLSGDEAIVRVQGPVRLSLYTEPEPDVALLRPRADFYASGHPGPADVLLVVEVADSSIDFDRNVKAYVYARSGVPEYWLVDLNDDTVVRYALPEGDAYQQVERLDPDVRVAPALLPGCLVRAGDLLP
jgi:Uma2 family endonuclease